MKNLAQELQDKQTILVKWTINSDSMAEIKIRQAQYKIKELELFESALKEAEKRGFETTLRHGTKEGMRKAADLLEEKFYGKHDKNEFGSCDKFGICGYCAVILDAQEEIRIAADRFV